MADLNKVLKGLECCQNGFVCGEGCPYREVCFNGEYAFTHLAKDALELLKEKTEDAVKKASEGVMPMAYWIGGRCSNCECDAPSFLSGSDWKESMTPYCPNCGARMENPDGEDGDGD